MASQVISFTVTTSTAQQLTDGLNSFVYQNGYQDLLPNGDPNPETKLVFAKRITYEFWRASIKAYNSKTAAASAVTTAQASVDSTYSFS